MDSNITATVFLCSSQFENANLFQYILNDVECPLKFRDVGVPNFIFFSRFIDKRTSGNGASMHRKGVWMSQLNNERLEAECLMALETFVHVFLGYG